MRSDVLGAEVSGPQGPRPVGRHLSARSDWRCWLILNLAIGIVYLALQNPYWARGGDSEVYLSMARSIVLGEGYQFNGQPAYLVQPVWPLMLASLLWISPFILPVKLLTMACLWAWLAISYWVVRYWAGPKTSALCIALIAGLVPVVPLSYLPFSDPIFLVFTSASLLLAFQIVEGRRFAWRLGALLATVMLASLTRSASITTWPLIMAILLSGRVWPRKDRNTLAAALVFVVFVGTFVGWRVVTAVPIESLDPRYDTALAAHYGVLNAPESATLEELLYAYEQRFVRLGRFVASIYFDPLPRSGAGKYLFNPIGWAVLGVIVVFAWHEARQRQWLGLVALLFVAVISLNWPNPPTRYLLPVAPLLTVGAVMGVRRLIDMLQPLWGRRIAAAMFAACALAVFAYNGLMYGFELSVARSSNFAARYQGGAHASMPAIADWVARHTPADREIGVTQAAPSRRLFTHGNMRAFHFLLNRPVMTSPGKHSEELTPGLGRWSERNNVVYYLYQEQFEFPSPLRRLIRPKKAVVPPWEVHRLRAGRLHRVEEVPVDVRPVTRVPGL